jgi:hypothetical protein
MLADPTRFSLSLSLSLFLSLIWSAARTRARGLAEQREAHPDARRASRRGRAARGDEARVRCSAMGCDTGRATPSRRLILIVKATTLVVHIALALEKKNSLL